MGMTQDSKAGAITLIPSIAESTEIAGVMIHSQKRSPVAKRRRNEITVNFFVLCLCSTLRSANGPPSPSLSALRTNTTYLIQTIRINIQNIKLETPTILVTESEK